MALVSVSTLTLVFASMGSLPPVVLWNRVRCTCQVQSVVVVPSCITHIVHRISLASIDMVFRQGEVTGCEFFRGFDESSAKASFDVELNVTVEEPDTYSRQCVINFVQPCRTNLDYLP